MKKRDSESSNHSGSSSGSAGRRRRQFQQQSSLEDDGAESDRELITIIQQDDQELAEAKIRAKQGLQHPAQAPKPQQVTRLTPTNRTTTLNAAQTSGRDVVTILREDDQELAEAKARAYGNNATSLEGSPAAPPATQGSKKVKKATASTAKTPEATTDTTRSAAAAAAASKPNHADDAPSDRPHRPSQQHTLKFLRDDQDAKNKAAKEAANARGAQYCNRAQAAAVNLALSSQQDLNDLLLLDDDDEEEEKVEEGILLHSMDDHHDFHAPSRGGFEPLVDTSGNTNAEESQPGAFRVGTSFAPASDQDDSDEADISWDDEEQEEAPFADDSHRRRENPTSLLDQSQKEEEDEEDPLLRPQSTDGDILVEATLVVSPDEGQKTVQKQPQETIVVPEPELVTAERMSDAYSTQDMIKDQKGRRLLLGVGCVIATVVIVAIIVIVVVVVGRRDRGTKSEINNVPQPPIIPVATPPPTMAPTSFFADVLPTHTQEAIGEQGTPQEAAYEWFLSDESYWYNMTQEVNNTELMELAQSFVPLERFALATLYFATGGDSWLVSNNWLDHSQSTCTWHTDFFGSICSSGAQTRRQRNLRRRELQQDNIVAKQYYNRLSLNKNNLTGNFPPEVSLLTNLDVLNVHQNSVGGTIPTEFGSFQHLTLFQVYQNKLSGTIPTQLGLLPKVRQLNLAFNELTGTIPTELGQLGPSLETLSTSNNPVEGVLPTELGLLTQLSGMFFYKNPNLTGPIPSELGALTAMTKLQLNGANWTGELPSELGLVTGLKEIYLQDNIHLKGSIPESWGSLTQLEQLWLHNTDITGVVPAALCNLVDMGTLQRLAVDCLQVSCNCKCDCIQQASPHGDEWITEAPVVELFYNESNDEGGGEITEEELPQNDGPEDGEVIDVDIIEFMPSEVHCGPNTTNNETDDDAYVNCGDDDFWWEGEAELDLNSGEVNPDGPTGQSTDESGEVADLDIPEQMTQPPPVYSTPPPEEYEFESTDPPEIMMQSSVTYATPPPQDPDGPFGQPTDGEDADIDVPEQMNQPPPVYATVPPEEYEFLSTDPPETMMERPPRYSTPPPQYPTEDPPDAPEMMMEPPPVYATPPPQYPTEDLPDAQTSANPSSQENGSEWTPPPEFFDENEDQPTGRSGSSNIFSH